MLSPLLSTFLSIALTAVLTAHCCAKHPLDLGVTLLSHEGDSAYLPCSYPQSSSLTILWRIKGSVYPVYHLPNGFERIPGSYSGLFLKDVSLENSGNYTCFIYNNSGLEQLYTVQFIVLPSLNISKENSSSPNASGKALSLQVTESDTVYIPCVPASGTDLVTVWRIDGITYPVTNLPLMNQHHYGGIVVFGVSANTIGSTYECYSTTNNGLNLLYTVTTTLSNSSVKNEFEVLRDNRLSAQGQIKLISRSVALNKNEKIFGFKLGVPTGANCNLDALAFLTIVMDHMTGTILWDKFVTDPSPIFAIPSVKFQGNNSYASTFTKNSSLNSAEPCARLPYQYRTDAEVMTDNECIPEGSTSCIPLPKELNRVNAIWPTHPASDDDCQCPVFLERSSGPQFSDCYCIVLHLTSYNVTLHNDQLCWNNLTRESNDTKILLVRDQVTGGEFNRDILSQTRITVQGPPPISPIINYYEVNDTICAVSKSEKWSPVIRAEVTVYDVTNDVIFDRVIPKSSFCIPLRIFPQYCAPFNVSIIASSQCTDSIPKNLLVPGESSSLCRCLQTKVNITLNVTTVSTTEAIGTLDISCLNTIDVDILEISNLYLQVSPHDKCDACVNRNISLQMLPCFRNSSFSVTDLAPSTEYGLLVKWISPNGSEYCQISQEVTFKTRMDYTIIIGAVCGGVGGILVLLTLVVPCICCCCCHNRHRERNDGAPVGTYNKVT